MIENNGCADGVPVLLMVTLTEAPYSSISKSDLDCFGGTDGSISVSPVGGIPVYSYLWSTLETTPGISGLSVGDYSVTVTDSFNCTNSDTILITFDPCSGLKELSSEPEIKIYPNPTKGDISFNLNQIEGKVNVSIFNVLGQKLNATTLNSGNGILTLELNKEWEGALFITFEGEFGKVNKKVIKL